MPSGDRASNPAAARCWSTRSAPSPTTNTGWSGGQVRRPATAAGAHTAETLEHVAMTLLRRYGVVFWRLLEREADWLPNWRE